MTPLVKHLPLEQRDIVTHKIDDRWRSVLTHVRLIALQCRSAARSDLFKACALLSLEENVARDAHLTALLKGLRNAMSRDPVFFRPGVYETSFDENWLIQALCAREAEDWDSFRFLIHSRIAPSHRRHVIFLICGILEQNCKV
ncbi:hypothetical protein [Planktotalea sp.]|uniref:hypothetical protein n=1 Tax=Planktotalea sp. TaxID=2029877 RepID=UPI00329A3C06